MEPGPQFQQLPMFMTAGELRDPARTAHGDRREHQTSDELFQEKLEDSHRDHQPRSISRYALHPFRPALYGQIENAGGVEQPVHLMHDDPFELVRGQRLPLLADGHHRVAVAHDRNPNSLLPVHHTGPETTRPKLRFSS